MGACLSARHVGVSLPGGRLPLRDASLDVESGEFVAIMGPSGAGKTTLLGLLGLLAVPTSGDLWILRRDAAVLSERERSLLRAEALGFMFQNACLVPELSLASNVGLPLRLRGLTPQEVAARVGAVLGEVGLAELADQRAGDLSGGEKQRAALARALVTRPIILLADEPTGALDEDTTHALLDLFTRVAGTGTAVVVVTHDPLVAAAADRTVRIEDGVLPLPSTAASAPDVGAMPAAPVSGDTSPHRLAAIRESLILLMAQPRRLALVMLAYALGIACLVAAAGLTGSARGRVIERMMESASMVVHVVPPADEPIAHFDPTLRDGPLTVAAALPGVITAFPVRAYPSASNRITVLPSPDSPVASGTIRVTSSSFFSFHHMTPQRGQPDLLDNPWGGAVAVVGASAAAELGVGDADIGSSLWVNLHPVPVVAAMTPSGDALLDDGVYLSFAAAALLGAPSESSFELAVAPGFAEPVAEAAPRALSPANPGSYQAGAVAQLQDLQSSVAADLGSLLGVISALVLGLATLLAGITLLITVGQRAPHIAIERTAGVRGTTIAVQFAVEGMVIAALGAMLGAGLGAGVAWAATWWNHQRLYLGLGTIAMGILASLAVGLLSAVVPALAAARQQPAMLLRRL